MKKTVLEYTTGMCQTDIPRQVLLENKIRLNAFFVEQESVQKKGSRFVYRYAFYSVDNPPKMTKQSLTKEFGRLPSDMKSIQPEQMMDMTYQDTILYGDDASPEGQERLAEYLLIDLYYWKKENLEFGIAEKEWSGYIVRITDLERTVCDAVKLSSISSTAISVAPRS